MGAMILLIMEFHTRLHYYSHITQIFAGWGFCGVDGFFFLSGLGLFYSLKKDGRVLPFYKRRLIRIIPTYFVIVLFANLLKNNSDWGDILIQTSTIGFWFPSMFNYFDWFVPSLVLIYLFFPFYYKIFTRFPYLVTVLFIFLSIVGSLLYGSNENNNIDKLYFLCRIPIFLLGVLGAYCNNLNAKFLEETRFIRRCMFISILGFIFWLVLKTILTTDQFNESTLNWTLFILIIPGMLYILTLLINSSKTLNKVLSFLGGISLELYLMHELIVFKYAANLRIFLPNSFLVIIFIFFILSAVSIFLAFLVQKIVSMVISIF